MAAFRNAFYNPSKGLGLTKNPGNWPKKQTKKAGWTWRFRTFDAHARPTEQRPPNQDRLGSIWGRRFHFRDSNFENQNPNCQTNGSSKIQKSQPFQTQKIPLKIYSKFKVFSKDNMVSFTSTNPHWRVQERCFKFVILGLPKVRLPVVVRRSY